MAALASDGPLGRAEAFVQLEFPPANEPVLDPFRTYHRLAAPAMPTEVAHRAEVLVELFAATFADDERTILVHAQGDPLSRLAWRSGGGIQFAHGYFASALHEIAHWCIAGKARQTKMFVVSARWSQRYAAGGF